LYGTLKLKLSTNPAIDIRAMFSLLLSFAPKESRFKNKEYKKLN